MTENNQRILISNMAYLNMTKKFIWLLLLFLLSGLVSGDQSSTDLFPVANKGKTGYINKKGEVVIPHQFEDGKEFSEGLATVLIDGKWGYINTSGEIVIKPAYWQAGNFSDGMAWIQVGRKYGYINKDGKLIIEPKYNRAGSFSEGFAVVEISRDKIFFIDKTGKPAITPDVYGIDISGFSEGFVFAYTRKDRTPVYLDKAGRIAISIEKDKDGFIIQGASFSEGMAAVEIKGKWGYIDKTGKFVIKPQYNRATSFCEGFAYVGTEEMKKHVGYWTYFIIDKKGKAIKVIPCPMGEFSEGLVPVSTWDKEKNKSLYGYVDTNGEMVIQPQFDDALPFRKGLARVKLQGNDAYIDKQGQVIWAGESRRNEHSTTYSGKSMLDIYMKCLKEENWNEAESYIQRMTREELVTGCLKTLEWLLEDPKRTESSDAPRWGIIGMVAVVPFLETYYHSFAKEDKSMDPTPFHKMIVDGSLDKDFRFALIDAMGDNDFYAPSWEFLPADLEIYHSIVINDTLDTETRLSAASNISTFVECLYMQLYHETTALKSISLDSDLRKRIYPNVVTMLQENPEQFSNEEVEKLRLLIDAADRTTIEVYNILTKSNVERTKLLAYHNVEGYLSMHLLSNPEARSKAKRILDAFKHKSLEETR